MKTTMLVLLATAAALAPLALAAAPSATTFDGKLHLSGDATHHGDDALVPDAQFQYDLQATGPVSWTTGHGMGSRVSGTFTGTINITYQDQDNNTVTLDSEPVTLKVEGERSSFNAAGVDGFKVTIQQTGQSGNLRSFVIPAAFTTGVSSNDEGSKTYAIADHGSGQAQFHDTQHFSLDVAGDLTLSPQLARAGSTARPSSSS